MQCSAIINTFYKIIFYRSIRMLGTTGEIKNVNG